MQILQSWKRSLSLFTPANFTQFFREVGRSAINMYKRALPLWYLWVPALIFWILRAYYYIKFFDFYMRLSNPIKWICGYISHPLVLFGYVWLLFLICLMSQASFTFEKDWSYIKKYGLYFARLCVVILITSLIIYQTVEYYNDTLILLETIFAGIFAPAYMLFYLDSNGSYKALGYSFIQMFWLVVHELPVLVILFVFLYLLTTFSAQSIPSQYVRDVILIGVLWPVLVNIWVVIYNKYRQQEAYL